MDFLFLSGFSLKELLICRQLPVASHLPVIQKCVLNVKNLSLFECDSF